ncbi:unnamed protein product [Rotaria sp. Silwood1]|nr:unnamed protein product [Rotaria sp. Silwood1]CAF1620776.1 unnamed protein product [Rotaria sp. Silwood1]CAF3721533.1 unnamed protein product [Rotaria sp. Silwood1]CAF3757886.1 unnamed protein product [Rotaria sp. Silwood1]CAF3781039.1 unnamed protein product [Rotaria sp. Silwood1]
MIAARNVRNNIKERVLKEAIPVSIIYEQEVSDSSINPTTIAILPTCQELAPTATKIRAKILPLLPKSCLFDIPDEFKVTLDGKRFLLMDETITRRERILLFSSDQQLDMLFSSSIIYMDGTFSKSPPHFKQIYIIRAVLFDICLPCVFCLLTNKKSVTYRHIFTELKEMARERQKGFAPQLVMSDFETGVLPVIKSEFPSAQHHACFFHFTQAIFRQIQHTGHQRDYLLNDDFRNLCRKLMALALMPRELITVGFKEVQAAADQLDGIEMDNILTYFENNWIDDTDLWNVYGCDTRTNNSCEGKDIQRKL